MRIWWLNQQDCDAIGPRLERRFPSYLHKQYESRCGRPGRGRLWAAEQFGEVSVTWNNSPLCLVLERCGGIVIREGDVVLLAGMPGIVTDMDLQRA